MNLVVGVRASYSRVAMVALSHTWHTRSQTMLRMRMTVALIMVIMMMIVRAKFDFVKNDVWAAFEFHLRHIHIYSKKILFCPFSRPHKKKQFNTLAKGDWKNQAEVKGLSVRSYELPLTVTKIRDHFPPIVFLKYMLSTGFLQSFWQYFQISVFQYFRAPETSIKIRLLLNFAAYFALCVCIIILGINLIPPSSSIR